MKKQEERHSTPMRVIRSSVSEPHRHNAPAAIGARVREERKSKGWSLAYLSSESGIPQSTLSKFETDNLSLPLDRIFRVADALGIAVTKLFDPRTLSSSRDAPGRRSITRAGDGRRALTPAYDRHWLFSELMQKRMFPVMIRLLAKDVTEFGELYRHDGEEFSMVLKGKVLVITDIYEPVLLNELDGIYFDSRMGHAYLNAGDGDATIISVGTGAPQIPAAGSSPDKAK